MICWSRFGIYANDEKKIARLFAGRFGTLAAMMFPNAPDEKQLQFCTEAILMCTAVRNGC
jgi:hypothetical protein